MQYPVGYQHTAWIMEACRELGANAKWADPIEGVTDGALLIDGVTVVWFLDNRMPKNRQIQDPLARRLLNEGSAIVCHAQRRDAERVGGHWLPLAATPRYTLPWRTYENKRDAAFVGNLADAGRNAYLNVIAQHINLGIATNMFYEDAAAVYHNAKVGLNVTSAPGSGFDYDINMHVFEIMACGVPLLTPANGDLNRLCIRDGIHCLTYHDVNEAVKRIKMLLEYPQMAAQLAENAYELIERMHRYTHRAEQLLEWVHDYHR